MASESQTPLLAALSLPPVLSHAKLSQNPITGISCGGNKSTGKDRPVDHREPKSAHAEIARIRQLSLKLPYPQERVIAFGYPPIPRIDEILVARNSSATNQDNAAILSPLMPETVTVLHLMMIARWPARPGCLERFQRVKVRVTRTAIRWYCFSDMNISSTLDISQQISLNVFAVFAVLLGDSINLGVLRIRSGPGKRVRNGPGCRCNLWRGSADT